MGATTRMPLRAARVFMSTMATLASPQKVTFAEMRESGARGLLVYCADYRCSHSIAVSADRWPDEVQLSDIEPRFTCISRGNLRRMDVRCRRLRRSQRDQLHRQSPRLLTGRPLSIHYSLSDFWRKGIYSRQPPDDWRLGMTSSGAVAQLEERDI